MLITTKAATKRRERHLTGHDGLHIHLHYNLPPDSK